MYSKGLAGFGVSTSAFRNEVLSRRHLADIYRAGFPHIELLANRPHIDYHDRGVQRQLADWFASTPAVKPSLHLPFEEHTNTRSVRWISALAPEERERRRALDEIKRALEITDRLPVAWVVLHLGIPGQAAHPVHFEYAYTLVDMIRRFSGVDILIGNIPSRACSTERIMEFIRIAELPEIRICYDIACGHLEGSPIQPEQVGAVHLSDIDETGVQRLWPFEGEVDWTSVAARIVDAGFDGPFIIKGPEPDLGRALEVASRFSELLGVAARGEG